MGAPLDNRDEPFRDLVNRSPDGILIIQDFEIAFLNAAAVELLGASRPHDILGKSPFEIFSSDRQAVIRTRLERVLRGEPVPPADDTIVRLDGTLTDGQVGLAILEKG